ncbi:hypothetical protein JHK87_049988 [Glycine soja]|nr:hypothetical protein JHK87_049988 [Glycine soja]
MQCYCDLSQVEFTSPSLGGFTFTRIVFQVPAWFCSWDLNNSHYIYVGLQAVQASPSNVARGLSSLYKEIIESFRVVNHCPFGQTVRETISCQFTFRGGRFQYLRMLAVAYEKTQELARDLQVVGCGDLDVDSVM